MGEELLITATSLDDAKNQIREIFDLKSKIPLKEISKKEYEEEKGGEREHSDNHLQDGRLGKETNVIPIIYKKYTIGPKRNEYYRVIFKHEDGSEMEDYFMVEPELE